MKKFKYLKLILGDQLNREHSWFKESKDESLYVFMEIKPESEYVTHHIQKVTGIFLCMRTFELGLAQEDFNTYYFKITDQNNEHSFEKNIQKLIQEHHIEHFYFQEPDEYRLDQLLTGTAQALGIPFSKVSSEHFLTERNELSTFFKGKKTYLMESFYRAMRKKHTVLMDEKGPITGKWNYDHENRKKLPKNHIPPTPKAFNHNVSKIVKEIEQAKLNSIGNINPTSFIWPKNKKETLTLLNYFTEHLLKHFGSFQDALSNEYWSMYHSRISFAMNLKIISPLEVIRSVEEYWYQHQEEISIAQAEGYIRQILGWREYMRGVYWAKMPDYESLNFFNHNQKLPDYFWTGETKMNCISKAVTQSLDFAYAHHIQRLMITGNFSLLAGISPDEVDNWYLGIYIDAFQWVEITNTRGMSQFADGGIVGTKPYISSASYIHKMGNHCTACHYNYKLKTEENACPFNSLYWNFIDRHKDKLAKNPRMSMMYRTWEKMGEKQIPILQKANEYLKKIEEL